MAPGARAFCVVGRATDVGLFRRTQQPLTWAVVTSSPKGEAGAQWGDTWFAADLVDALTRAGQQAKVVHRGGAESAARESDDVVVVLRGLRRVTPRRPVAGGATWMLWVISHPEMVEPDEPAQYDAVFAASANWPVANTFGVPVEPLLQATNPRRFSPDAAPADSGADVLFAGSTRGEYRPVVRACVEAGIDLTLYGVGWGEYLDERLIAGEFLPNDLLPVAYAGAGVVLNDHWHDMASSGFLSNRLFDAVASGTRVLSDRAAGLETVFGDAVRTYGHPADIADILREPRDQAFASRSTRLAEARRIAQEHSFDARAARLIERARELRGRR